MKGLQSGSRKVILLFLIAGAICAIVFGFVTTRSSLENVWFTKIEYWIFPTQRFWLLASALFFVAFGASYALSIAKGWLDRARWFRILCAFAIATSIPILLIQFSMPASATIGTFLSPFVVTLGLSAAMFVLTKRWFKWATVGIFLIYVIAPLLAGLPDIFIRGGSQWFSVLTFFFRCSGLMALCGWWLASTRERSGSEGNPQGLDGDFLRQPTTIGMR
jgi:hypothetical protein